jgi:hypothetical protein
MKIDKSSVGLPSAEKASHAFIIEGFPEIEQASQFVTSTDVIAGKNIEPPHASQENIFSRPPSHPSQLIEFFESSFIVQMFYPFQIQGFLSYLLG